MIMDTIRKWLYKPKADDKSLLARFYHADYALTAVASELDSFDGRAEPERCSRLVSRLRQGQDRVLAITNQIMDELLCDDRTPRAFRAKFPEEVLQESLAGQLWFGAECLAAGSSIMNREEESATMRPLAKAVTKSLDTVRNLLREQCLRNNIPNSPTLSLDTNDASTETLYESLKIFDRLFAEFELSYVSAMVQVKTKEEHEMQELICVLFSETLQRALQIGLLEQDQVDSYDPSLMFSIPRLAIVAGLVIYDRGPLNMDLTSDQMSEMFRPFRQLLLRIKDLLRTLSKNELYQLEKLLCTNEDIHLKNNKSNCDDDKVNTSDDDLVSNIVNDCRSTQKDIMPSFYPPSTTTVVSVEANVGSLADVVVESSNNEWDSDNKESREILGQPDCATGYLIPNTNLGSLLQTNEAPLTDSFISTDDDEFNTRKVDDTENTIETSVKLTSSSTQRTQPHPPPPPPQQQQQHHRRPGVQYGADSGISTENTSSDRTPDTETNITIEQQQQPQRSKHNYNPVLTRRYQGNWDSLEKTQPSCSKPNSDSSDESDKVTMESSSRSTSKKLDRSIGGKSSSKTRSKSSKSNQQSGSMRRKSKSADSSSSSSNSSLSLSSCDTSSCQSEEGDPQEVALAIRAAGRMKFKGTENLLHRLFVCIAGVADQLQTNFASDLRQILRSVFLINTTPIQEEITIPEKAKENDMFEFRASENDVIHENSGGSNQSIYSAEEVSPEVDSVFENGEVTGRGDRSASLGSEERISIRSRNSHIERSRSLGEAPCERDEISAANEIRPYNNESNKRSNSVRERVRNSSSNHDSDSSSPESYSPDHSPINSTHHRRISESSEHTCRNQPRRTANGVLSEKPPRWIPDEEAPRCMACAVPFTAFRRRHHCRNCGGVFCGICSNSSAPLPNFGLTKAVRVCRDCYVRVVGA